MKKIIALVVLSLLWGCTTPPVLTETPIVITDTPVMTHTPFVMTETPDITDTPVVPTLTLSDAPYLPDPASQPGVDNPDVTQENIQSTICVNGYTSTIRPPISYTDNIKGQQIAQYGYADTNKADYEEDHLIPLEVGGNPTDLKNLWPQPRYTMPYNASMKDTLENMLHKMVCSGQLPLDTARQAIAADWVAAYRQYVGQSLIAVTGVPTEP